MTNQDNHKRMNGDPDTIASSESARSRRAQAHNGELVERIRELMAARGMSMRGLARAARYNNAYVCRVLNGERAPSRQFVRAVDRALAANGALVELSGKLSEGPARHGLDSRKPLEIIIRIQVEVISG